MISRISGTLEALDGLEATIRPEPGGVSYQVFLPAYSTDVLRDSIGKNLTLHTIQYVEQQGPSGAMTPRLIGFASVRDRRFFELLTANVEGVGNRKALRALVHPPAAIARAVASSDAAWLQQLPEIGKKTAERMIVELRDRVAPFLIGDAASIEPKGPPLRDDDPASEAIGALTALGETRADAERMVHKALRRNPKLATPDAIVQAAYAG